MNQARLPMPAGIRDPNLWEILTTIIFPAATDPAVIALALRYCERRGLDVLKKPVNIVPVWNSKLGRNVETIWPSITEIEITAARSREWAGLDPPVYGPPETHTFRGKISKTVTFPAWCERTVHRLIRSERRAFTERAHWRESYGRQGGSELPNYMWEKRPYDQIAKVAKAAALRSAFPEEAEGPTDAEAAGMIIPGENMTPPPIEAAEPPGQKDGEEEIKDELATGENAAIPSIPDLPHSFSIASDDDWRPFGEALITAIRGASGKAEADRWRELNLDNLNTMARVAPRLHGTLMRAIEREMLVPPPPGAEAINEEDMP
jgi:phage recombination protein Bet